MQNYQDIEEGERTAIRMERDFSTYVQQQVGASMQDVQLLMMH